MSDLGQLTFPCSFTFKIIGHSTPEFEVEVLNIMIKHFPHLGEAAVKPNYSANKKYLALSITVDATAQTQLDNAYQELSKNPLILFVL